ncbi:MAG: hypothetical protein A2Y59_01935 [Chloroflexi bacterium RBG_13_52_14]|jgi:heme exporter protein D|nr:MAG: hypothetical protein A2Y59_01935 [Chloroflexi bacterium RBG_13_52_14]
MEWYFILAIVLGIPIILFPIALVWYLNVSGLYQVLRDVRQRQRRRAEGAAEAKKPVAAEQGTLAGKG